MNVESFKCATLTEPFNISMGVAKTFDSDYNSANENELDSKFCYELEYPRKNVSSCNVSSTKNNPLFNNVKFLYEYNTDRSKKRSEQMKRMQLRKGHVDNTLEELDHDDAENPKQSDLLSAMQVGMNSMLHKHDKEESQSNVLGMEDNPIVANNEDNKDAEVVISDLESSFTEEEQGGGNITTNKSFVPLRNNLVIKSVAKEDNLTSSYLLALTQCNPTQEEEENEEKDEILSLPGQIENENKSKPRHIRLPSGKNYLINSVIEEEMSEVLTDSELSIRKHSYLFSAKKVNKLYASKTNSGNGTSSLLESKETFNERNTDQMFFNKQERLINTAYYQHKPRSGYHSNSKSEIPPDYNFINSLSVKKKKKNNKVAKSDVYHIQFDLKRNFDDISRKITEEEERNRSKVESTKKSLIDKFFNKSKNKENISIENISNKTGEIPINLKINIQIPLFTGNSPNFTRMNPSFIEINKAREQYYEQNSGKKEGYSMHPMNENREMQGVETNFTPIKEDFTSFDDGVNLNSISIQKQRKNFSSCLMNNNVSRTINPIESKVTHEQMKEKYKKDRRHKSSIFKSDDLRISKTQNINLQSTTTQKNVVNVHNHHNISINEQYSFINLNNNVNICSPMSVKREEEETDKTDKSKSIVIPFQLVGNKATEDEMCQLNSPFANEIKQTANYQHDKISEIKRKLFVLGDNVEQTCNQITSNMNISLPAKKVLTVSNEININVIPQSKQPLSKIRKNSMEITKNKANAFTIESRINSLTNKHAKNASMNLNNLSFRKNNTLCPKPAVLNNISNMINHMRQNSSFKSSVLGSDAKIKGRSTSGSVTKQNNLNTAMNVSRNKIGVPVINSKGNDMSLNKNLATTISGIKIESKNLVNLKQKQMIPSKKKPQTQRTLSQIIFSNKDIATSTNPKQGRLLDLLKKLKFPKESINVDHFKLANYKLSTLKSIKHLILIEESKYDKKHEFKGIYEINEERQMLIKIYGVSLSPSAINFRDVVIGYTMSKQNELSGYRVNKFEFYSELLAFGIKGK